MSKLPSKAVFFQREAARHGDALNAAGIGLQGIGRMLAESELNSDEINALHHAVIALGAMVSDSGGHLFSAATELEGKQ